jgi:hypothetical protein
MLLHPLSDIWGCAIVPRGFAYHGPRDRAPGLGDSTRSHGAAAAVFPRCQSEVGDQLAKMSEPRKVAHFGDDGGGNNGADAFESLQCGHQLRPTRVLECAVLLSLYSRELR